jgi:hypothetical protein
MKTVYIAGPMRNHPAYNFPAFDAARDIGELKGFRVISPADLDRELGFDETRDTFGPDQLKSAVRRDAEALTICDAIAMLPGWEKSLGAQAELAIARWLGLEVLDATTFEPIGM